MSAEHAAFVAALFPAYWCSIHAAFGTTQCATKLATFGAAHYATDECAFGTAFIATVDAAFCGTKWAAEHSTKWSADVAA